MHSPVVSAEAPASPSREQQLRELLRHPGVWRGQSQASIANRRTGFAVLDRLLPGHGWPVAGMVELLCPRPGIGELQLLLPTLRDVPQCWVAPPYRPYAPALQQAGLDPTQMLVVAPRAEDLLWTLEQVLRAGTEAVVLGWCAQASMTALRRLQLAADCGQTLLFLLRPVAARQQSSPAMLRLYLDAAADALYVRLLKARGGRPGAVLVPIQSLEEDADVVAGTGSAPAAAAGARPRAA